MAPKRRAEGAGCVFPWKTQKDGRDRGEERRTRWNASKRGQKSIGGKLWKA